MREMRFKMERPGLVEPGQQVHVSEKKVALNYTYIIDPAVAMSGCYKVNQRIHTSEGVVKYWTYRKRILCDRRVWWRADRRTKVALSEKSKYIGLR